MRTGTEEPRMNTKRHEWGTADGRRFFGGMFFWACLIRVISCLFVVKKSRRRNTIFGSFSILESVFWDNAEGCGNVEES